MKSTIHIRCDILQDFFFILELIGTIAFAVSGAVVGIKKNMDIFGVCVLSLTAACGGGLIRDVFIGKLPPAMFCEKTYAVTAIITAVTVFCAARFKMDIMKNRFWDTVLLIADSLGLGIFTSVGVAAVYDNGFKGMFFAVFLGTITGVGGGLIRDMMAGNPPYIFVKHIYACASIAGAVLCCLLWNVTGRNIAMVLGCVVIVLIRLLSAHFRLSLPKVSKGEDNE